MEYIVQQNRSHTWGDDFMVTLLECLFLWLVYNNSTVVLLSWFRGKISFTEAYPMYSFAKDVQMTTLIV